MPEKLLTPAEVVEHLDHKITIGTLGTWRSRGKGPEYLKLGGKVVYLLPDLEKWMKEKKVTTGA